MQVVTQRTFWHLQSLKRVPSDYEVKSSRLLYYPGRGFEVRTPISEWYRRYQHASRLPVSEWETFSDPAETTYASYVARQAERESFVDGLFRSIEGTDHDERLATEWVALLGRTLPVLRYPYHGLQMVAAYVGHLSPAGKIAILEVFQVGDEIRKIQRFAYRMRQLRDAYPTFGQDSKQAWLEHPAWQPLRRAIEHLLVTYDFGEAFVALNALLKPTLDHAMLEGLRRAADEHGDSLMNKLLFSLGEDAAWHRDWSMALLDHVTAGSPGSVAALSDWVDRWQPLVHTAVSTLADLRGASVGFQSALDEALEGLARRAERCRA